MPSDWARFWTKVNKTRTCWLWTAGQSNNGYPVFSMRHHNVAAHRWLYEQEIGPIPDGLDLDHLCRVRHCVRPTHLEPVTRLENLMRSPHFGNPLCPHGHQKVRRADGLRCNECNRLYMARRKKVSS